MVVALALDHQPELLGDPLRWPVARIDDGDQPLQAQHVTSIVAAGGRGLGSQTTALQPGAKVVADLDLGHAIDLLGGQAAVANELPAVAQREQPQPKAMVAVEPLAPRDPSRRLLAAVGARVVAHDLGVPEQPSHVVQVIRSHLAEGETRCRRGRGHADDRSVPAPGAGRVEMACSVAMTASCRSSTSWLHSGRSLPAQISAQPRCKHAVRM
jgi:hypothetical protein